MAAKKVRAPRKPTAYSSARKEAIAQLKRARTTFANAKRNAKSYGVGRHKKK